MIELDIVVDDEVERDAVEVVQGVGEVHEVEIEALREEIGEVREVAKVHVEVVAAVEGVEVAKVRGRVEALGAAVADRGVELEALGAAGADLGVEVENSCDSLDSRMAESMAKSTAADSLARNRA